MIHVILDVSALLLYASREPRSIAVGELMMIVEENGAQVAVPAVTFIDACRACPSDVERNRLVRLVKRLEGSVAVLPLQSEDVTDVATKWPSFRPGQAHAVIEAMRHGASIATADVSFFAHHVEKIDLLEI
jgi:hypothetical protein